MHDEKTVQRFIELRSQGWTYARLIRQVSGLAGLTRRVYHRHTRFW